MLLDKYVFRELVKSQFVVLLVLVAIFAGQSIVRLMTEASLGNMPPRLITLFMLYSLPEFLIFLFPLTLYVAIIITLGRICSDSEMVVMRCVGYSPTRIMMVAQTLALVSVIIVSFISLDLVSRAANARYELEQQATTNPEFLPIDSGRFVTLGNFNIYVEDVRNRGIDDRDISNIYVIEMDSYSNRTSSITAARDGHLVLDQDGVRWLELNDGRRYEIARDGSYYKLQFEKFRAPLSGNITEETRERREISRMSTRELLLSPDKREQVEAQWRFSPIFATFVLCMVAVPLSMVNPRQGRFARLMPAIVIYVAYYLFLMSLRNLILTDTIPLYPGLYVVPLVFLLFVAIPLNLPKSYIKRWSRKSRATTAAAAASTSMTTPSSAADATAAKDATKSEAETAQSTERAASTKSKASAASASSPNKDEKAQRSSDDSEGR